MLRSKSIRVSMLCISVSDARLQLVGCSSVERIGMMLNSSIKMAMISITDH